MPRGFLSAILRRISVRRYTRLNVEDDADALGLENAPQLTVSLPNDRSLSEVTSRIKAEEVDPKVRAEAAARAKWLRTLDSDSIVALKQETASPATLGADGGPGLSPPSLGQMNADQLKEMITSAVASAAATENSTSAEAGVNAAATSPLAPTRFGSGARSKPRGTGSNIVPPSGPPHKKGSQFNTTKVVPSTDKENNAKERSSAASDATGAATSAEVESSDDEEISATAGAKKQKSAAAMPACSVLPTSGG